MSARKRFALLEREPIASTTSPHSPASSRAASIRRIPQHHLATLQRTAGNGALLRVAGLAPPDRATAAAPRAVLRRAPNADEPEDDATEAAPTGSADRDTLSPELQTGPAAQVLDMLGDLNDYLGLGLDIADLAGAAFLESAAMTAAAGILSLLGQALFILEAIGLWISAWGESDRRVAILGSCAGIVATARGEDAPPPPQGRWLGTPQDRDRWNDVWWRNTRSGRDWVRDSLDLEHYRARAQESGTGIDRRMLAEALFQWGPAGVEQVLQRAIRSGYEQTLPRVLALLLKARESPAEALNALYQPLAREHLAPGADRERYTWPP